MRISQRSLTINSSLAFCILCCTGQVLFDLIFIFFLLCLCMYLSGSCAIITQKFDSLKLRYMQLGFQRNSSSGRILLQITANISLSSEVNLGKKESDTQKAKKCGFRCPTEGEWSLQLFCKWGNEVCLCTSSKKAE